MVRGLRQAAIWSAACLSGAAALAYEICWSRALVVPLGNSTDAAALVLAGFMLGMALGARWGGALAERTRAPLRAYALLEAALGGYAFAAAPLLAALSSIHGGGAAIGSRYAIALLLITVPGLAMGASLPLLVRALAPPGETVQRHVSIAYAANTLGAATGACATGFWGIAAFGVWRTTMCAAGASLLAAIIAWALGGGHTASATTPVPAGEGASRVVRRMALLAAGVSGASMLACEMLWARVLTFVFGHDTYAFSTLLATVLLGLSLGGALHRGLQRFDQRRVLAWLMTLHALTALGCFQLGASLVIARGRDPFDLQGVGAVATSVWLELYRELAFTPLVALAPAVCAGAVFPAACSLYAGRRGDVGRAVGIVTLVNGIGSASGALLAAFVLVPPLGIQRALGLCALLTAGAASLVLANPRNALRAALPALSVIALALVMPPGMPRRMLLATVGPRHQTLLHYEEARTATVSVIENGINGERQLLINGVNEVTTRLVHDQSFKLLGHLAPLLHPAPRRVVMICLGAGIAAGAVAAHPIERLDVIDLSSAVASGARHFAHENRGVLDDPVLQLHAADGRQFLLNARERYDVAVVDSTHPKSVDSWILYTRQFYQLLHDRLADGGMVVQWLPLHGLSEREFKIVVRTFSDVFPDMTMWANAGVETYGHVAYAKLVGTRGGTRRIDLAELRARLSDPVVSADLATYGISSLVELLDLFVASGPAIADWTRDLPVQTDDRPIVPYTTAYSRGRPMLPSTLLGVRGSVRPLLDHAGADPAWLAELDDAVAAQGLVLSGDLPRAALRRRGTKIALYEQQAATTKPYYLDLARRYADDVDVLFEAATQLAGLGSSDDARDVFRRALEQRPSDFRLRLNHALLTLARGAPTRAIAELSRLRSEQPGSPIVLTNLGAAVLASGEPSVAAVHLEEAIARDPDSVPAHLLLTRAYLASGDLARAASASGALLAREPFVGEAHALAAEIALRQGDAAVAVLHAERARQQAPYDAPFAMLHASALHAVGDPRAEGAYRDALALDPALAAAWHQLGLLASARGDFEAAADRHIRALDIEPEHAAAAHALGLALRGQRKPAEAVGAFCLALRIDPSLAVARRQLAEMGEARACSEWDTK